VIRPGRSCPKALALSQPCKIAKKLMTLSASWPITSCAQSISSVRSSSGQDSLDPTKRGSSSLEPLLSARPAKPPYPPPISEAPPAPRPRRASLEDRDVHPEAPLRHLLSFLVSTSSQEGQTKMNCSKRTPNFGIVLRCFMVSPQEGHTSIVVLSATSGEHSMTGIEGG
jgi:hypothetical protein